MVTFKLFTSSYQLIRVKDFDSSVFYAGTHTLVLRNNLFMTLANGIYYYTLTAVMDDGRIVTSRPDKLIIMR